MYFGTTAQLNSKCVYTLNGTAVTETKLVKDLGIYISGDSNWDEQVIQIYVNVPIGPLS